MDAGEPLHDTEAVRAIDREAIARGTPGFELMQRAARAAFGRVRSRWPQARRVLVACGRGNNGGDGFLLAGLLREAGLHVQVCAAEVGTATSVDARRAREAWLHLGSVDALARIGTDRDDADTMDLAIDALLGIGLTRAPEGEIAAAIEALNALGVPILALDVPSGLDADRGATPGHAVRAAATLTFIADKRGLHTGAARDVCGEIECDALEVDASLIDAHEPAARLLHARDLARWLRPRARNAHKGHHGHVLCLGGDHGMGGAVRLCAEGALRAGAGWVSVATRAQHVAPLLAARPEAMTRGVESGEELSPLIARADVLALGPGLGQGEWGRAMHAAAMRSAKPCVIDADALNLLAEARHAHATEDASNTTPAPRILTPHPGEAARLLGVPVRDIEADRFAAAMQLADTYGAVVVLKGAGTIVAAPHPDSHLRGNDGVRRVRVIAAGNPGMASAGMGDVLTGVIAALLAQGLDAFDAACAGTLLHAAAGDAAARKTGERGLLASDLFDEIHRCANPAR